jgi:hypothetical protein
LREVKQATVWAERQAEESVLVLVLVSAQIGELVQAGEELAEEVTLQEQV